MSSLNQPWFPVWKPIYHMQVFYYWIQSASTLIDIHKCMTVSLWTEGIIIYIAKVSYKSAYGGVYTSIESCLWLWLYTHVCGFVGRPDLSQTLVGVYETYAYASNLHVKFFLANLLYYYGQQIHNMHTDIHTNIHTHVHVQTHTHVIVHTQPMHMHRHSILLLLLCVATTYYVCAALIVCDNDIQRQTRTMWTMS